MSSAVLEIKEKFESLTREERIELLGILEDIEDNAAADAAKVGGEFVPWEQAKLRIMEHHE